MINHPLQPRSSILYRESNKELLATVLFYLREHNLYYIIPNHESKFSNPISDIRRLVDDMIITIQEYNNHFADLEGTTYKGYWINTQAVISCFEKPNYDLTIEELTIILQKEIS